jgi:hypothetical protein
MPLQRPTTTPVPDEIFDEWLAVLGHAELRVLLYIVRRTFGFDKRGGDTISYRQFTDGITTRDGRVLDRGCGVSNRTNLSKALKNLEERGLIRRVQGQTPEGDAAVTFYVLWFAGEASRDADDPRDRAPFPSATASRGISERKVAVQRSESEGGTATVPPGAAAAPRRTATALPGDAATAPPVVPQQYPQETVEQQTEKQETGPIDPFEGSTHNDDEREREALRRTIADFSRELGDADHERANLTRATNLWRAAGVPTTEFIQLLYDARALTRHYQGKQPPGRRIEAKGAYFFAILTQMLTARGLIRPTRDPPAAPTIHAAYSGPAAMPEGGPL